MSLQYFKYFYQSRMLIDAFCLLSIGVSGLFIAFLNQTYAYDDAFITYRYAYNFANGNGFVYNINEWFLGTTAPLYGLLLGLLGLVIDIEAIPRISGWISGGSLILIGYALYTYGRLHGHWLGGFIAGLFFVSNRLLPATFGGEILFQVALIAWAFVFYRINRTLLAALLLAFAILTRPDALLALGVVGLHYLIIRRQFPWRECLVVAGVLLPFLLLAWVFYGSFLPGTLSAKVAQRDSGLWPGFAWGLFEWLAGFTVQGSSAVFPTLRAMPYGPFFILFSFLGVPALLIVFRFWYLPLAWAALFVLAYGFLNVPFYHWYVIPVVLGLAILISCGVEGVLLLLVRIYAHWQQQPVGPMMRTGLSLFCLLALSPVVVAQLVQSTMLTGANPVEQLYSKTGRWISRNTPQDASIGYLEIGRVGYYARRRIIDPLGLIEPTIHAHVAQGDLDWAYEHYRPDYIINYDANFGAWFETVAQQRWFQEEYRKLTEVKLHDNATVTDPFSVVIYKRVISSGA